MKSVLIIGATSAIAAAVAKQLAPSGTSFYLLGRNPDGLKILSDDLLVRGAKTAHHAKFDATEPSTFEETINGAFETLGVIDTVLICHGSLPDQEACESDCATTIREIQVNGMSTVVLLTLIACRLEPQGCGSIAVITSVAGDRGRQSNYVYGASKAMVSTFLQGLRNRLHKKGVTVLDIKPGFVDTPMTAQFDKGLLWAQPQDIGKSIVTALDKKKDIIYTPGYWRIIMLIIRSIPESIFKRLSL